MSEGWRKGQWESQNPEPAVAQHFVRDFLKAWIPRREGRKEGRTEWQELVLRVVRSKIITGLIG